MKRTCLLRALREFWWSLRLKVVAACTLPLDSEVRPPNLSSNGTRFRSLCDEVPGRHCRNGYGSLEVGGLRDRVND
jgi:hypothetical protein